MKNRKRILLCALATVALGSSCLVMALSRQPPDPVYGGEPLSKWAEKYSSGIFSLDFVASEEHAIREIGTNGLPLLLNMLKRRDSGTELKIKDWIDRHPFLHLHWTFAYEYRVRGLDALRVLGPVARSTSPEVVKLLRDENWMVRLSAQVALKSVDPEAAAKVGIK